jgi:BirA family biotin operon repressor/biotin-[acetyl-CoA-carboxylase] ligase
VSDAPPTWDRARKRLATTRFAELRAYDELPSTNLEAMKEAGSGAPEGLVVVADHQSAGRGRRGRTWAAERERALLVSVLLRPRLPVERLQLATMAAGLAAADGVQEAAGFRPGLKWPNDLVVGDRKLAGMLVETAISGGDRALVVGVGFNVAAGAYPAELAGAATSCEEEAGHPVDREDLLVAFLVALDRRCAGLAGPGGWDATLAGWRRECITIGRRVRVDLPNGELVGTATGVAWNGHLIVVDDGDGRHAVGAGDVVHLRPA